MPREAHAPLQYWQAGPDPGQRLPAGYWTERNETLRGRMLCKEAFGGRCVSSSTALPVASRGGGGGLLFWTTFGRLTNCLIVLNVARMVAHQLGKRLVLPLCASAENTQQSCSEHSRLADHEEANLLVNLSAIYDAGSLGGCHASRPALDLRDARPRHPAGATALTCVAPTAEACSWMLATNYQFEGMALRRHVRFDVASLVGAWLERMRRKPEHERRESWAEVLRRQDGGEPCLHYTPSRSRKSGGTCGCGAERHACDPLAPRAKATLAALRPCMRSCEGVSIFDAAAGDVFLPDLFEHAAFSRATDRADGQPEGLDGATGCSPLALSARAASQAAALAAELPPKFVCVHWRAGDFLSPTPLTRLHGKSMLSSHRGLSNATFVAHVAARAARAAGASRILLLTNARRSHVAGFEAALREARAPKAMVRLCTDCPPDGEKHVCARAAGLVLSGDSSFSAHIRQLAPAATPHVYIKACGFTPKQAASPLLAGRGPVPRC